MESDENEMGMFGGICSRVIRKVEVRVASEE